MNPRTRRIALYAIGLIAILASANALAHSYAGLYEWAIHHRLSGWQAKTWPAEIDVFLAVGELALYVAYLDASQARQRIWPWTTALTGLTVSIAGNIGHIEPVPGHPVALSDRLTAATSPIAAFAGLTVGLLVLKMTRQHAFTRRDEPRIVPTLVLAPPLATTGTATSASGSAGSSTPVPWAHDEVRSPYGRSLRPRLLRDAQAMYRDAAARGERLSQRTLARQLRRNGHRFPNEQLRWIAHSVGLAADKAA